MKPHGIIRGMRRTLWAILAALIMVLAAGCSFATKDPDYVTPAPLPPLEQLQQVPVTGQTTLSAGEDVTAFLTADKNIVCAMTSSRGGHLNLPYEANSYSDAANNKFAVVPVVHCELAKYAAPDPGDIADDCAGTGLGYLGGTVLLTPEKAVYGSCRSGVTQMESEFGPKGSREGPVSKLRELPEGQNIERNGLRCSAYNGGVACGNVSGGVAFFVTREGYQLISDGGKTVTGNLK
ncbi:Putative lipoprotein [Arthrobacter sp. 9V]|nr:Putative lipoprotein [Arthrobacter sp. 9V]